jgi:hypothetical protein
MNANFDLPIPLDRLTKEELTLLNLKSAQDGKSTSEVVLDAFRSYAKRPTSFSGPSLASSPVPPTPSTPSPVQANSQPGQK